MLRDEHLDAAVEEGILSAPQAQALRNFAAARERARIAAQSHEERFRFMRGFNDFFFATGVLMLGAGVFYFAGTGVAGNIFAALIIWALAELLVSRMRLVLPGILLAFFFVEAGYRAVPAELGQLVPGAPLIHASPTFLELLIAAGTLGTAFSPTTIAVKALAATAAAALFYWRFRLPFALLLLAGGLVVTSAALMREIAGAGAQSLVLLICGIAVFAAAMAFDLSDRERVTRRADCAFWLHLLAAPLIVHSLVAMSVPDLQFLAMTTPAAVAIVAIVIVLALIAVVIDRRALLVSTLSYLGFVIAYAIKTAGASGPEAADRAAVFFLTLAALGMLVLTLGVGWQLLRRALLALLPASAAGRLPPATLAV